MSWRTPDDKFRKPIEIFPEKTDVIKNYKFWSKRRINYLGDDRFFDQEVRTGVCYFCNKEGRENKSETTILHHAKYDHRDPLAWTIEVCSKCHWHIFGRCSCYTLCRKIHFNIRNSLAEIEIT